jgi:quercetin dioxygenase-like cupin family protein
MEEGKIVKKDWGEEEYITNTLEYCAKFLYVAPGFVCSIHRHLVKTESFHVVSGEGVIGLDGHLHRVVQGNTLHIPRNSYHFFASLEGMTLLEVSTHHEDSDVQRANNSHKLAWGRDNEVLKRFGLVEGCELS